MVVILLKGELMTYKSAAMENVSFNSNIKGSPFEVCINPADFCKAYKVFELRQNGQHFQYIYQDNNTSEFFLAEDSKLSLNDLEPLIPQLSQTLGQQQVRA
jgi:hypothetical protein